MTNDPIYLLSTAIVSPDVPLAGRLVLEQKPFISVELLPAGASSSAPEQARVLVFTSAHSVEAVGGGVPDGGLPGASHAPGASNAPGGTHAPNGTHAPGGSHPDWRIYCTAGATAEKVAETFGTGLIAGTGNSARALAAVIIEKERPQPVCFFCGDRSREELPAELRKAGFSVVERVVYRTLLTPQKVDRSYRGIAFFSPSGVESYFAENSAGDAVLFAIGASTADAIRARCDNPVIVGDRPGKSHLIKKMIGYFDHGKK